MFKKCREDKDNVLFIDASNEFDKAKNQNYLTEENVLKIIDTYTKREAIDKYSAPRFNAEIKENDYNLNIPRYVDTFEEEEPVDLAAVSAELQTLEAEMTTTDATIAKFCEELGIAKPF